MDVRVAATCLPAALQLHPVLAERQDQRRDWRVQLGRETNRVELQAGERMVRLRLQDLVEVVDDLHRARVEGGRAGRPGQGHDLGPFPAGAESGAVGGDAAADDDYPDQCESGGTMRRVSATSRLRRWTRSAGVSNLMSGCRYLTNL